ncbi:SDR family NAD(P)-dependent oxidoreductase [Brevundimonas sp.]|uniref:SDR family NAD(P)-dependent oxidoreductase n=1 Tax=Brevundimonas sp. TaxID=1871086 RepID=UPI0039E687AC
MTTPTPRPLMLITGASAGLGEGFARLYAAHGWDLALTARRTDRLEAVAAELRARHGAQVLTIPLDLAEPGAADRLVDAVEAEGRHVDGLINNAGYSLTGGFLSLSPEQHAGMLAVMAAAPVALSRRVAPGMVSRGFGRILNVASLAGFLPATGGDTLYGPLKSFLIKASQGLHLELKRTGVHVTVLCPGYTLTEFHDANGSRDAVSRAYPSWMWMEAEPVIRAGYEACEANRPVEIPGAFNRFMSIAVRVTPTGWALKMADKHARRLARLPQTGGGGPNLPV